MIDPNSIKLIGKLAFPSYRGRTFRHDTSGSVHFCDTNWGGGTRNTYAIVRLSDGAAAQGRTDMAPWANPVEGRTADIPQGFAIVEHTIFCGKDLGLRIYTAPLMVAPELPRLPGAIS